jgi:enolase
MIIQKIFAEEVFNAHGMPTAQCTIQLSSGQTVKSSIPSGFVQPKDAAAYLYDTNNRIIQERMQESINIINTTIVPLLIKQPINVLAMDSILMDLASTHQIGSNTTLAVSLALFKAQAAAENRQLFESIQSLSGTDSISLPVPLTSLFESSKNDGSLKFKEILVIPKDNVSYELRLHATILLHHHTKKLLEIKKLSTATGQYGSFISDMHQKDIFALLEQVVATIPDHSYDFGLNMMADGWYDPVTKTYAYGQEVLTSDDLIKQYQTLKQEHPSVVYLQDALAHLDAHGWKQLTANFAEASSMTVAADAIFASNPLKIRWGILQKIGTMVIIKPEYVGTISQTIAAIDACKHHKKLFCIAGDTMGTHDSFISDLAAGTGAKFLKAGAPFGSEHMTKYNRLLEIERFLQNS